MAFISVKNIEILGGYVIDADDPSFIAAIISAVSQTAAPGVMPFINVKHNKDLGGYVIDTNDPTFIASVQAVISGLPANWQTIYQSADFTTLTPQNLAVDGSYTIDGYRWWSKLPVPGIGTCSLDANGLGMTVPVNQANTWNSGNYSTTWTQKYLYFPYAQIPKYTPGAPVAVQWRPGLIDNGDAQSGNSYGRRGQIEDTDNIASITAANFQTWQGIGWGTTGAPQFGRGEYYQSPDDATVFNTLLVPGSAVPGDHVFERINFGFSRYTSTGHGAWSGSFPSLPATLDSPKSFIMLGNIITGNQGFFMTLRYNGNVGTISSYIRQLRVLQPRQA